MYQLCTLAVALTCVLGLASAKPEQIRAVQDPIFHLYLQAYPEDREFFHFLASSAPRRQASLPGPWPLAPGLSGEQH